MLDINYVRANPDAVQALCKERGMEIDVNRLLDLDRTLRDTIVKRDLARQALKSITGPEARELGKELKREAADLSKRVDELEAARDELWHQLPNLLAPDTPEGKTDADNKELRKAGPVRDFSFPAAPHEEIGKKLKILDLRRGVKVAGSGFFYWRGDGARLVWALFNHALAMLTARGFEQMFTPVLAHKQTLFGTGYFPFARDETYKLEGADLCLIGTSEQTLVGYHAEETIAEAELPLLYTAFSPCFRTEAGSYGRESKGAFRVHQFHKVEQIVFCRPDESDEWLARCQENIEAFMDSLELHYRVVRVCKGDMGAAGYKKFDTEAWFPGFGAFRETHSNTNLIDYQTRRMGAKIGGGSRHKYPHTISATMATDRVVLAILEQYQNQDGSITVPRVLRGPLGGRETVTVEAGVRSFIED